MSADTRNEGRRFFTLHNWTALCGAVMATAGALALIAGLAWAAWGRDTVDAQIRTALMPIDRRIGLVEQYMPRIEDALARTQIALEATMTAKEKEQAERLYAAMRRDKIRGDQ